jgi:hypothetical protein
MAAGKVVEVFYAFELLQAYLALGSLVSLLAHHTVFQTQGGWGLNRAND